MAYDGRTWTWRFGVALRVGTDPVQRYLRLNPRASPAVVLGVVLANLLADVLDAVLDPRIRLD